MKKTMATVILALASAWSSVAVGDIWAPSASIIRDGQGTKVAVIQPPVGSYGSPGDNKHGLGFSWWRTSPEGVTLEATVCSLAGAVKGDCGSSFVSEVSFEADGEAVSTSAVAATWGAAQTFRIPMDDFLRISRSNKVVMKVLRRGELTTSTFGTAIPKAQVNERFAPFLAKVQEIQSDTKGE
jgi:hypothetical protein